jgi:hypothetical protein
MAAQMTGPVFDQEHRGQLLVKALEKSPPNPMRCVIFSPDGTSVETYAIDAKEAVTKFPEQWSYDPWPKEHRKSSARRPTTTA